MSFLRILIFSILILITSEAAAGDIIYGLAMHGAPKYSAAATHLDYVNPDAPKGGTLQQAAIGSFDTLNPFSIKGTAAQGLNLVTDRLMGRVWDEPFTLYPLIAERVEVPADRSSFTVHINPRARFHDGSAITADDVLFSWQTLREHGRPNMRRVYKLASKAEKLDNLTVRFTFGPGYDRETVMIFAIMPVLSAKWWQGKNFDATTLEPPLSNGPYKIAKVDPGHQIIYERVKDYWARDLLVNKGLYNLDRMVFDYYRDDTVAFEAFKAGAINLRREFNAGKWASAYDFPARARGDVIAEAIPHHRPEQVRALIFNTRRPPFDDIRVRQALELALDFEWLNKNLFRGQYKRIASYFPNSDLADGNWQPPVTGSDDAMRANLIKADALLKSAGWVVKNGQRVRIDDPTKHFHFEITLNAPEDEKIALSYTRELQRLGIDATIRRLDSAAFTGRLNTYDYDMVLYWWLNTLSPGSEQTQYWSCEAAKQPGRFNYAGVCDPQIDSLSHAIADATTTADLYTRTHALDRALMAGDYMIPLYYAGVDDIAYRKNLHHPAITPLYGTVLETWWAQ